LTPAWVLFSWLSLPLAVSLFKAVRVEKGAALNKVLAGTGRLALLYSLLFSIGLLLPIG
jgi:1,4-dihydroxy-2-naphthoate octaprenyltransferase